MVFVPGSNRIDVLDPRWEIYLLVQERKDNQEYNLSRLLGFAAVYRFHRYPESTRVRLGQVNNGQLGIIIHTHTHIHNNTLSNLELIWILTDTGYASLST